MLVRTYDKFVEAVEKFGLPDIVSFDHDLGGEIPHTAIMNGEQVVPYEMYKEKTGMDCARWLAHYCMRKRKRIPAWRVHSMNVVGKKNIEDFLNTFAHPPSTEQLDRPFSRLQVPPPTNIIRP